MEILETVPAEEMSYTSPKRDTELKEIFEMFESEKKGLMKISDLGLAVKCLGIQPTDEDLRVLIRSEG